MYVLPHCSAGLATNRGSLNKSAHLIDEEKSFVLGGGGLQVDARLQLQEVRDGGHEPARARV